MAKKVKNYEVSVIPTAEVATIPSKEELQAGMRKTLKELDDKLAELSVPDNVVWKAPNFSFVNYGVGLNCTVTIQTCSDTVALIRSLIDVNRYIKEHEQLVKELKLPNTIKPIIGSYTAQQVAEDLERRIKTLTNAQAIQNIKNAKTKLEAFLSEDDRLIKTLSEVEGLLK